MKHLKKMVALMLVGIMCLTTGMSPLESYAEEKETADENVVNFETSAGGSIKILDDNQNVYEVTSKDTEPLELTVETGTVLHVEIIPDVGYEAASYKILTDSGEEVESVEDTQVLNAEESYGTEIEVTENVSVQVSFSEVDTKDTETSAPDTTESMVISPGGDSEDIEVTAMQSRDILIGDTQKTVYNPGGKNLTDVLGVTRENLLGWLGQHVNDDYYLGTPYIGGDNRSPNGDTSFNGYPGMNCTGFVWHALTKAGANELTPGVSGWVTLIANNGMEYVTYTGSNWNDISSSVAYDGICEPGDIIWTWDMTSGGLTNGLNYNLSPHHHISIFIGHYFDDIAPVGSPYWQADAGDDRIWHSSDDNLNGAEGVGNVTTWMVPKEWTGPYAMTIIKMASKGTAQLHKSSANPDITDGNSCYSLEGAKYGVYSDSSCTVQVETLITDADGNSNSVELAAGGYWIKEIEAPKGYLKDTRTYPITVNSGQNTELNVTDVPGNDPAAIELMKIDQETGEGTLQGAASLAGAQFTVKYYANYYETVSELPKEAIRTWVLETKPSTYSDGTIHYIALLSNKYKVSKDNFYYDESGFPTLPMGTITIQETKAPEGYLLDGGYLQVAGSKEKIDGIYIAQIRQVGDAVKLVGGNEFKVSDKVIRGGVKVQKRDYDTKDTSAQGNATLEGAVFEIVNRNDDDVIVDGESYKKNEVVKTLKTDKNGTAKTEADLLPFGHYLLREKTAPSGYLNSGVTEVEFDITENGKIVDLTDQEHSIYDPVIRGGVKVQKRDFDTKDSSAQGAATLENATFTITSLNDQPVMVEGKLYNKNDVVKTIKTDKMGYVETAADLLPYGKYLLTETGAPTGYLWEGVLSQEFTIKEDGKLVDLTDKEHSIQDRVKRGDFEIRKIDSDTQNTMADVQFKVTSVTTGESHKITTDANGYYSSSADWNKHTYNTNKGGAEDGLWFGLDSNSKSAPINDELGALPYDTYLIEEIPSEANEGKVMFKGTLVISRNNVTVNLGNIENKEPDEDTPAISTTAKNEATGNHYAQAEESVTIVDSVLYSGLEVQKEYTLKGWLMNRETGKKISDEDGNAVTAEKAFRPAATSGIVEMEYVFDASKLGGADVVVFEELYLGSEKIAEHTDIEDEGQTVHFAEIGTKAADADTNTNMTAAKEEITIVDTVFFKNLKVGEKYTVSGKLIDKETGKAVTDAEENLVTAETSFTAKTKNGIVDVTFVFDGSKLGGKMLVAFETLEKNGKVYAVHADLEDEDQTIYIPKIGTSAKDQDTGTHEAIAKENTTILDTVSHEEIVSGEEYTLKGILMEKESGKALLIDGKEVTAEKTFTAGSADGEVEMEFTFDASGLNGKSVVVFEKLYWKEIEIASHEDLEDENQTIAFINPKIRTTAKDQDTGTHEAIAKENTTILDTVSHEEIVSGEEYTVKGILMEKESGKALLIKGKEVTAEKTFTAGNVGGEVEMKFTFDASSLNGKSVVVFEKLYWKGIEIASHEDLEDENQTINFPEPEIGTTAKDKDSGTNEANVQEKTTIVDTVAYKGLIVGQEYAVRGTLIVKSTGKPFLIDGKEVTAEKAFTAEKADGSVEMEFTFDSRELNGESIVVFEKMYWKDIEVAVHEDIKDKGQTVTFVKPKETFTGKIANGVQTGLANHAPLYAGIGIVLILLAGILIWHQKKQKDNRI